MKIYNEIWISNGTRWADDSWKIEADSEEIATEMVKNGNYTDKDVISIEPYNKHDSYFAIWSV